MQTKSILILTALFSQCVHVSATIDECVDRIEEMHNERGRLLSLTTLKLMQNYNSTCHGMNLCDKYIDPLTLEYLESKEFSKNPTIPDVPIIMDITAEFAGFEEDISWAAYSDTCDQVDGKLCRVNVDLSLQGAALDLFDVDIKLNSFNTPVCLDDLCDDVDLEKAAEAAVRSALIKQMDLDESQENLVRNVDREFVCAGLGLHTCDFTIKAIDCTGDLVTSAKMLTPTSSAPKEASKAVIVLALMGHLFSSLLH